MDGGARSKESKFRATAEDCEGMIPRAKVPWYVVAMVEGMRPRISGYRWLDGNERLAGARDAKTFGQQSM